MYNNEPRCANKPKTVDTQCSFVFQTFGGVKLLRRAIAYTGVQPPTADRKADGEYYSGQTLYISPQTKEAESSSSRAQSLARMREELCSSLHSSSQYSFR